MIKLEKIMLASGSPRRAEILNAVGWPFEKRVPDVDETILAGESPFDYVERLACLKAETVARSGPMFMPVVGADTIVVIDDTILGKPVDITSALSMLQKLSGRRHEVLTGIAVANGSHTVSTVESTSVKFAAMTKAEIEFLAANGEPLDKAGGYAVQAQAALFIEKIDGDYWNVVGLPVRRLYELITRMN